MYIPTNTMRLFVLASSFVASTIAARPNGWIPEPPMERVHLVFRVGEKFTIATPDSTDDFCRWRFIAYASDEFYSYQDGIDFINGSGIIKFKKYKFKQYYHTLELRPYYDCLQEDQRIMIFKAVRPGRVIFYMQNKPSWQYQKPAAYVYGCHCSPTIREFIIDVI